MIVKFTPTISLDSPVQVRLKVGSTDVKIYNATVRTNLPGSHRWEGSSVSYRQVGALVKSTEYYISFKSFIKPKNAVAIDALTVEISVSSETGSTTEYELLAFSSISVPVMINYDNRNSIRLRTMFTNGVTPPYKLFTDS